MYQYILILLIYKKFTIEMEKLFEFIKAVKLDEESEDSLMEICDRIDTKYSIPELIQFLERYELIDSEQWLSELKYYLIEFKVYTLLNSFDYFKEYLLTYPRILRLIVYAFKFILKTLVDVNITRFYHTNPMNKEFVSVFQRETSTVFHCSLKLCMRNAGYIQTNDIWYPVLCSEKDLKLVHDDQKIIDIGVWKEYIEYLEQEKALEPGKINIHFS